MNKQNDFISSISSRNSIISPKYNALQNGKADLMKMMDKMKQLIVAPNKNETKLKTQMEKLKTEREKENITIASALLSAIVLAFLSFASFKKCKKNKIPKMN